MSDLVLTDGDLASFQPAFGAATVIVQPGRISGSGPWKVGGKPACVDGDEASVKVAGCTYMTPVHSIPGTGELSIAALAGDQRAGATKSGGKPVLIRGSTFSARFTVQAPAMQPPPGPGSPIPDATPAYEGGQGSFVPANQTVKAG